MQGDEQGGRGQHDAGIGADPDGQPAPADQQRARGPVTLEPHPRRPECQHSLGQDKQTLLVKEAGKEHVRGLQRRKPADDLGGARTCEVVGRRGDQSDADHRQANLGDPHAEDVLTVQDAELEGVRVDMEFADNGTDPVDSEAGCLGQLHRRLAEGSVVRAAQRAEGRARRQQCDRPQSDRERRPNRPANRQRRSRTLKPPHEEEQRPTKRDHREERALGRIQDAVPFGLHPRHDTGAGLRRFCTLPAAAPLSDARTAALTDTPRPSQRGRLSRRRFLLWAGGGVLVAGGLSYGAARSDLFKAAPKPQFDVRDFGAKGDGVTNDTSAFQRAAAAINAAMGGTLLIPSGTYVVGRQGPLAGRSGRGFSYPVEEILYIHGCRNPVEIRGDGATLKAQAGLRFGSFDPLTGEPHHPPSLPFVDFDYRADAYRGMVRSEGNSALRVRGLELDGNIDGLRVGGHWGGDAGWQCSASGINSYATRHLEVEDVSTHHHGLDGLTLGHKGLTVGSAETPVELTNVSCEHNARQGLSYVGGIGLSANDCCFSHTGKARLASPPAAGVDVEPEESVVRRARFRDCEFVNNTGSGFIADGGDSADIELRDCLIRGSKAGPAVWPRRPAIRFEGCKIYGWVVNAYGSPDMRQATRFVRCEFEDKEDPDYGRPYTGAALLEMNGENVSVEDCSITANRTRSVYLDSPLSRELIRGCRILHRNDGLPPGEFQALVRGSALEGTSFVGAFARNPPTPYYVAHDSVSLGRDVRVEGKDLTWGPEGQTGLITGQ